MVIKTALGIILLIELGVALYLTWHIRKIDKEINEWAEEMARKEMEDEKC